MGVCKKIPMNKTVKNGKRATHVFFAIIRNEIFSQKKNIVPSRQRNKTKKVKKNSRSFMLWIEIENFLEAIKKSALMPNSALKKDVSAKCLNE
jgi:hypothetical protein